MNAYSKIAYALGFIPRLALVLALVLSQGAAAGPVIAQEGGPERVTATLDPNDLQIQPALTEITTADSATRGVVDVTINEGSAGTNYGFDGYLQLGFEGRTRQRALVEPSLSKLPPNATITNATFNFGLCGYYDYIGEARTITFRRVTSPWHQSLASWNHAPTTAEVIGSKTFNTPDLDPDDDGNINYVAWYSIDLTSVVNNWVKGVYPNYGFMMTGAESLIHNNDTYLLFCSNSTTEAPYLSITYTTTAPTLAAAPSALGFVQDLGGPAPESKSLKLSNNGSTLFEWQAVASQPWIQLNAISGQVGPGSSQTIGVSVNPSGLGAGTHSGQITLTTTTPGAAGFPSNIPVTLSIADFDELTMLPLVSKAGTTTQPPAATRDVVTLIIGISEYLYLTDEGGAAGERAGEWGDVLYYAGLDSTKERRTLSVFGLHHAANESNCSSGATGGGGLVPSSLPDAKNNILTLIDSQATLENIQAAFAWLDEHEGPNTTVQIFYSGHGGKTQDLDGAADEPTDGLDEFIAAYDTNYVSGDYVNVVTDDLLDTWLSSLESTHVAVLLDSCFSGGMIGPSTVTRSGLIPRGLPLPASAGASASTDPAIELAADLAKSGRDILTASTVNEASYEVDELQQGVFSYYLMMALLDPNTDTNHDTIISVQEAYNYLSGRVSAYVASFPDPQTPQYYPGVTGSVGLSWSTAATSPCK